MMISVTVFVDGGPRQTLAWPAAAVPAPGDHLDVGFGGEKGTTLLVLRRRFWQTAPHEPRVDLECEHSSTKTLRPDGSDRQKKTTTAKKRSK